MEHILDLEAQYNDLVNIFKKIQDGNTILFLGAGASIGEKRYLSKELIELYEQSIGIHLEESNITDWIDIISSNRKFNRVKFDNFC